MNAAKTKKAIKSAIQLSQQFLMNGGAWACSPQQKSFLIQRTMLLKMFHLPCTKENFDLIFTYPLSPSIDLFEPVDELHCDVKAFWAVRLWQCRVEYGSIYARRAGQGWTIEEQVEFVYQALVTKACEVNSNDYTKHIGNSGKFYRASLGF